MKDSGARIDPVIGDAIAARHKPDGGPSWYTSLQMQPKDYCRLNFSYDELRGAYLWNIYKYLARFPNKGGVRDLEKASDYLNMLIESERS